ncbi:MAG TPA: hypothetical protein VK106_06905, partial [Balneolaceae bacterium]|nr:hypothetical protein [Balneolaceae bacterium]
MKEKGFIKNNLFKILSIVAFLALCIYYLYPTLGNYLEQNYISNLPAEQAEQYKRDNRLDLINLRQKSLSLGLDLQGGMRVTLQLDTPRLIKELAGRFSDEELEDLISEAAQQARTNNENFVSVFTDMFNKRNPNGRLSRYFRSDAADITRRSTNSEVIDYLKEQETKALDRAVEVIR